MARGRLAPFAVVWLLLMAGAVAAIAQSTSRAQSTSEEPAYVGTASCIACHTKQHELWKQSHHAWAWNTPTDRHVLGDFSGARFESPDLSAEFRRNGSMFMIETLGQDGKKRSFPLHSTVGVAPLQQYLLEVEAGRLQAFDLVWDTEKERWYHLYPGQRITARDGLHWTGPYKNWNARCAECHATGYKKNYDPRARTYASSQAEMAVGCEACHGPGEAHLAWAQGGASAAGGASKGLARRGLSSKGLTAGFSPSSPESEIQQCAACHARREALTDGNPLPGTAFHDAYQLALLRPGLYHADGSIQDEVYVYGSFLQSKMYAKGVRCSDCHEPHSGRLRAEGNAVCTQCHSPAGNERFSTLTKADYESPSHHFHPTDSAGAQCSSCHMIERVYMGVDGRRDHSFRIPRPDLSGLTGAPNACTDCHSDKDAGWAAARIADHFPSGQRDENHFSVAFAKGRQDPAGQVDALLAVATDQSVAAIVRATALDLLRAVQRADLPEKAAELLGDTSPLVRGAALRLQRGGRPADVVPRVLALLDDRYKSVRITAALVLSAMPIARLPERDAAALRRANAEWQASLVARADFPETHLLLGGVALTRRNLGAAEAAFREVVRQDAQLVDAWRMLVEIRLALRDPSGAAKVLDDAFAANPGHQDLQDLARRLGRPETE